MKLDYRHTTAALCGGLITGAITNNLPPLFFLIFRERLGVSLAGIALLVTLNFLTQLVMDLLAALFGDRIGRRVLLVASAILSSLGTLFLGVLPFLFENAFYGLLIATVLGACGSGLAEATSSPTMEDCPLRGKTAMMSFLHSFYCWGIVLVVLLTTAFLAVFGKEYWWLAAILFSLFPAANALFLAAVPIPEPKDRKEESTAPASSASPASPSLLCPAFLICLVMMVAAGASELSINQWISAFVEEGLSMDKALGDLLGTCLFALLMGSSRLLFALFSTRLAPVRLLLLLASVAAVAYPLAALSGTPAVSLIFCALLGLSVGALWPGTLSLTAARFPRGGTRMFSLCALFGDLGCSAGPALVGLVADSKGGSIGAGLATAAVFPLLLVFLLLLFSVGKRKPQ